MEMITIVIYLIIKQTTTRYLFKVIDICILINSNIIITITYLGQKINKTRLNFYIRICTSI